MQPVVVVVVAAAAAVVVGISVVVGGSGVRTLAIAATTPTIPHFPIVFCCIALRLDSSFMVLDKRCLLANSPVHVAHCSWSTPAE